MRAEREPVPPVLRAVRGEVVDGVRRKLAVRPWFRGVLFGACVAFLSAYVGWEVRDAIARDEAAELRRRIGALDYELQDVRRVLGMISHGREDGAGKQGQEERR